MATLTIRINMDNAAFEDAEAGSEVARILHGFAGVIESYGVDDFNGAGTIRVLRDINGNTVGSGTVEG